MDSVGDNSTEQTIRRLSGDVLWRDMPCRAVIEFSSESDREWLRNSLWCTSGFDIAPSRFASVTQTAEASMSMKVPRTLTFVLVSASLVSAPPAGQR